MIDPTLTITLSRASLSLPDLVLSARLDGTALGITSYSPAEPDSRDTYAADSPYTHGSELVASVLTQASLGFEFMRVGATSMAQVQAARDEVQAATRQFSYEVTTQVADAPAELWAARPAAPPRLSGRRLDGLTIRYLVPVYAVTIPVYPIAGS